MAATKLSHVGGSEEVAAVIEGGLRVRVINRFHCVTHPVRAHTSQDDQGGKGGQNGTHFNLQLVEVS